MLEPKSSGELWSRRESILLETPPTPRKRQKSAWLSGPGRKSRLHARSPRKRRRSSGSTSRRPIRSLICCFRRGRSNYLQIMQSHQPMNWGIASTVSGIILYPIILVNAGSSARRSNWLLNKEGLSLVRLQSRWRSMDILSPPTWWRWRIRRQDMGQDANFWFCQAIRSCWPQSASIVWPVQTSRPIWMRRRI